MDITNKKELLAALAPWVPSQFGQYGEPRSSTIFFDVESDRALEINKQLLDNLKEEFNRHPPVDLPPQDFIRIAARDIDLNTQQELLHFMWQCGIIWETVLNRIGVKQGPQQPFMGEN